MMEKYCDNTSVGVIVTNARNDMLLLDRARFPFGLAAPAGHIDEHGSPEQAAVSEVYEETGLKIPLSGLEKVIDARRVNNHCRRINGDYHIWTVFRAKNIDGKIVPSHDETKGAGWYAPQELQLLAELTRKNNTANQGDKLFELIWLEFLTELDYI